MSQDRSFDNLRLEFLEGVPTGFVELEGNMRASESCEWLRCLPVILDELPIEVAESQERLYSSNGLRSFLILHHFYLFWIDL